MWNEQSDLELLRAISQAFDEPSLPDLPTHLRDAATASFSLVGYDAQIARAVDSWQSELVGLRRTTELPGVHRFETDELDVEVRLLDDSVMIVIGPARELNGRIVTLDSASSFKTDVAGECVAGVADRPVRVEIETNDGLVTTGWIQ